MKTFTRLFFNVSALLCLWIGFSLSSLYAQMRVGSPAGSPDPSATLDVSGGPYSSGSPYRGFLPPKVALSQTTQAAPVSSPASGLLVYNTAKAGDVTPGYYYWEGGKWARLSTATTGAGVAATNGAAVIFTENYNTVDWVPGRYMQIVPVGLLSSTGFYTMRVEWNQVGVDQLVQLYVFAMSGTDLNPINPNMPVLTPTSRISWSNGGRYVTVRYKAPTVSGQTTYGLQAEIGVGDVYNGTLSVTVYQMN